MSSTFHTTVEISQPVLHSATNSRLSQSSFRCQQPAYTPSSDDLISQKLARIHSLKQPIEPDNSAVRFQTKYASPENMMAPRIAKLSITSIEADALNGSPQSNGVGGGPAFSDTSSDVSDSTVNTIPTSAPTATVTSGPSMVMPAADGVTDEDINQVEIFYRSHKTEIRVCRSLANLYVSVPKIKDRNSLNLSVPEPKKPEKKRPSKKSKSSKSEEPPKEFAPPPREPEAADVRKDEWEFAKTGIPLLVLDTGEHLRERRLSIVLAEKGTGFMLWSDVITHLTKYTTPHENFHTITLSTDSTRLVGLSFDEGPAANEFAEAFRTLTSNPDDELLNLSNKKKQKKEKKKAKYKPPKKIEISQPCCFVHVTKLERPDYLGIPLLVFPPPPSGAELTQSPTNLPRAMSVSSGISDCSTTPSMEH